MKKSLFNRYFTYLTLIGSVAIGLGTTLFMDAGKLPQLNCKDTTFQIWNKLDKSVDITISALKDANKRVTLHNGKINGNGTYDSSIKALLGEQFAATKPNSLTFLFNIDGKKLAWDLTPKSWDSLYLRIGEEKGIFKFGPQTGPAMGLGGKTEAGCPVTKDKDVEIKSVNPDNVAPQAEPKKQPEPTKPVPAEEPKKQPEPSTKASSVTTQAKTPEPAKTVPVAEPKKQPEQAAKVPSVTTQTQAAEPAKTVPVQQQPQKRVRTDTMGNPLRPCLRRGILEVSNFYDAPLYVKTRAVYNEKDEGEKKKGNAYRYYTFGAYQGWVKPRQEPFDISLPKLFEILSKNGEKEKPDYIVIQMNKSQLSGLRSGFNSDKESEKHDTVANIKLNLNKKYADYSEEGPWGLQWQPKNGTVDVTYQTFVYPESTCVSESTPFDSHEIVQDDFWYKGKLFEKI